jgi:hypothetical protein
MDGLAYAFERDSQGYVLKLALLPTGHPEHMPRMTEKSEFGVKVSLMTCQCMRNIPGGDDYRTIIRLTSQD